MAHQLVQGEQRPLGPQTEAPSNAAARAAARCATAREDATTNGPTPANRRSKKSPRHKAEGFV
ncbi:hypothetical protein PK68_17755 [Xanthomonas phaseoli pv. phaseoli]|nr:hypothetical protein PK68_17755 [Xanthomonas phaseoli pv. phaseoli]